MIKFGRLMQPHYHHRPCFLDTRTGLQLYTATSSLVCDKSSRFLTAIYADTHTTGLYGE